MGTALADGLAKNAPPRKIQIGEYIRIHKLEQYREVKLTRDFWLCGVRCWPETLKDDDIRLINQIDRPGRYIDRLVEVSLRDFNGEELVSVSWNCKTVDQRAQLGGRSLSQILKEIVEAQKAEDKEDEEQPAKRRPFGMSRATQQARERAAERG
jgi:hypothetical protein